MIYSQSPATLPNSFRLCHAFLKTIVLAMIFMAAAMCPAFLSDQNAMKLTIQNQSGYPDDQVYFIMICQTPLGYLDFRNHVLVETPSFNLNVATMTATLAQLKNYSGDGTCSIPCPVMGSSRIYFCFGQNFDQMGGFSASGPEMGSSNPVPWDMFEVNLSSGKYLDQSNVDFFSIAYTLTVNPSSGGTVTVGITTPSETIFGEFAAIPSPADSAQQYGNSDIFKALIVKNAAGETIRVIAPKAAALGDINATDSLPQMFTHFLDDYVNNYCWKPGRTFSFSSKLASDTATYYGKVSADGLTLSIYTDAAMTTPYTVPSLPRPSNAWGSPDFKNKTYLWHNVGVTSTVPTDIDWGYLIFGQDGYTNGPGAYWITDPVAMAIPVSIVRGVMHLDNGTVDWKDSSKYYLGTNGASASAFPIFYYGQILHRYGIAGRVYALSFDDIYGNDSGIGFTDPSVTMTIYPFRSESAVEPCAGDFDGDGKTDPAVYDDRTGRWVVRLSQAGYVKVDLNGFLGGPGWLPAVADYDGDLIADPAVYQETNGAWKVKLSRASYYQVNLEGFLGNIGWAPTAADYDGDRQADPAVYQSATGGWHIRLSSAAYRLTELNNFAGGPGYSACSADFDGDRLADPTVYNRADGTWIVYFSNGGAYTPLTLTGLLGGPGSLPAPGDYDGDGLADPAVMEPMTGDWSILLSRSQYVRVDLTGFLGGL